VTRYERSEASRQRSARVKLRPGLEAGRAENVLLIERLRLEEGRRKRVKLVTMGGQQA